MSSLLALRLYIAICNVLGQSVDEGAYNPGAAKISLAFLLDAKILFTNTQRANYGVWIYHNVVVKHSTE